MKTRDLIKLGIPPGLCVEAAHQLLHEARARKRSTRETLDAITRVVEAPAQFSDDATYGALARCLVERAAAGARYVPRPADAPHRIWGTHHETDALELVTLNPALQLGIADRVGSIEKGKDADLVIYDRHPLSVYAVVQKTIIDGRVMFDRALDLERRPRLAAEKSELEAKLAGAANQSAAGSAAPGGANPQPKPPTGDP